MEIIGGASPQSSRNGVVESLRELLGRDVLLLHWPKGKKGDDRKWRHLSVADMAKPKYLAQLRDGNIGVAVGSKSAGLCSIDVDSDEELQRFLDLNPRFKNSCITKGNRGANIWAKIVGPYPSLQPLKIGAGKDSSKWGEWRADGGQTIIHGTHPDTGRAYRFLERKPPIEIGFEEIRWPDYVFPKLSKPKSALLDRDDRKRVSVFSVVSVVSVKHADTEIDRAIEQCIPVRERDNHNNCLFRLARHTWTVQKRRRRKFSEKEIRSIVQVWFDRTPTQFKRNIYEDYVAEFTAIIRKVRCSIGDGRFDDAVRAARTAESPSWMAALPTEDHRRLLLLCRELQRVNGDQPFYLSCRMAAEFLENRYSHQTTAFWLGQFVRQKFLKLERRGGESKQTARAASRYRWNGK